MTTTPRPGFTIVVPSYEQGRFIDATIRSLLDQRYPDLEIIVVDGGSGDDTCRRLAAYGDAISWTSEPDQGQADALRKGFARATKPWLGWLNSDDVLTPGALHAVADGIAANPDAAIVYGRGHFMAEDGRYEEPYPTIAPAPAGEMARVMFESGYVAQPSVFFRRSAYEAVGGIDAGLRYVMDYELWVRFARAGLAFAYVDRDLSGNRRHGAAKTITHVGDLYAEAIAVQRRHFGRVSPYFVQAVSDHRFRTVRAGRTPARNVQLWRWLYFKATWLRLNFRRPLYCLKGLVSETIAASGPLVGDTLPLARILADRRAARRCHQRGAA